MFSGHADPGHPPGRIAAFRASAIAEFGQFAQPERPATNDCSGQPRSLVLERWASFDTRFGIVRRRPDVDRAFDFGVAR